MADFRIGTAPVSWGIAGPDWGPRLPVEQVLSEMAMAGFTGTELGPWGYLPTAAAPLRTLLDRYGLTLASAFCPVDLHSPDPDPAEMEILKIEAALLAEFGARDIIMSDGGSPHRQEISGRVKAEANGDVLDKEGWRRVRQRMERVCEISAPLGLRVCYHQHVGTYVETEEEIAAFMEAVDGLPVGLCLDTGHLAYAGCDPVAIFRTYASKITYCHLKDFSHAVLERCLTGRLNFSETTRAGVFVPLGRGDVDYASIFAVLNQVGYAGWLIAEQDRLIAEADNPLEDAKISRAFLREMLRQ